MKKIAAFLFLLIGSFSVWMMKNKGYDNVDDTPVSKDKQFHTEFDKFKMSGIEHTYFEHGSKKFTFYCDELIHRKRKVGPITVNPIKEIQMRKVRIELNQDERRYSLIGDTAVKQYTAVSSPPIIPGSLNTELKKLLDDRGLGFISRGVMADFTLNVSRKGIKHFTVRADTVTMGFKSSETTFDHGLSIVTNNGDILTARKAIWNNDKNAFYIPKKFIIKNQDGANVFSNSFVTVNSVGKIIEVSDNSK